MAYSWKSATTDCEKMKLKTNIKRVAKTKATKLTDKIIDGPRSVDILDITPKFAMEVLEKRNSTPAEKVPAFTNRNLRGKANKKTSLLILDIKQNEFYPSLIKFSTEGALLDGQHRLFAISQAGKTCQMIVETGANPASMVKTDIGIGRTDRDVFGLDFLQHWNLVPKLWAKATQIGKGMMCLSTFKTSKTKNLVNHQKAWNDSFKNKKRFFHKNKKHIIFAASAISKTAVDGIRMQPFKSFGPLVTFAFMHKINAAKAKMFALKVITGGEPKTCPSSKFREIILSGAGGETLSNREIRNEKMQKLFFCADRYLKGKSVSKVSKLETIKGE